MPELLKDQETLSTKRDRQDFSRKSQTMSGLSLVVRHEPSTPSVRPYLI